MTGRIVVGVDGSSGSGAALRWALAEARVRGDELNVVMVWHQPFAYSYPYPPYGFVPAPALDVERATKKRLDEMLAGEHIGSDVLVNPLIVKGLTAPMLIEASQNADLLVVGSRGWGAFQGMLLGSVSQHCVTHARCPVAVIPASDD